MNETTDIEVVKATANLPPPALVAPEPKQTITAAQAKVEAVASLTMKAYDRASTLHLTAEEVAAIQKEFPDEAFREGAAGKADLIYIEHAHLRDRLNQVFGPGQWAIVPRNRWAEDFTFVNKNNKTVEASRVYVEAMLLIRGCFVAEAVGDMVYYKNNDTQNYGDAVEGAKTAALRRCAKELGIGLQAWKKEFCDGWWARKRGIKPALTVVKPQPTPPQAKPEPESAKCPTEVTRKWFMLQMSPLMGTNANIVLEYFQKIGQLLPNEKLEDLPLRFLPASKDQLKLLFAAIAGFEAGDEAKAAFPAHQEQAKPPVNVARNEPEESFDDVEPSEGDPDEPWRRFPMPFGKSAGVALEDLSKNYLFGLWANYKVETEYNGKPKKAETIAKDTEFRNMLDMAGRHYQFEKKD